MENKLQQAKDTISKKYGYESFEQFDDKSTFSYNHNTPKIIDEIAIEYHRLMIECNVEEEKEEQPILVGYLNKEFGYVNHLPIQVGAEVFSYKDRYFFNSTTLNGLRERMTFYKETLHDAIDFI